MRVRIRVRVRVRVRVRAIARANLPLTMSAYTSSWGVCGSFVPMPLPTR